MSSIPKTGTLRALIVCSIMLATNLSPVLAAEQPLTLQEIVNNAIKNNPAVVETEKKWEEKSSRIPAVTAQPNLKVGFMKDDIPTTSLNPGKGMMTEFSISQEIMNPGYELSSDNG